MGRTVHYVTLSATVREAAAMFSAQTRGIVVRVEPSYLEQESSPDEGRFVFAYRVVIENEGPVAVQLLSRRWQITDGNGMRREVTGRGVVGEQPSIAPGDRYEYTSGCPLATPTGIMVGSYRMVTELGETLDVAVPAFSLDTPDYRPVLN